MTKILSTRLFIFIFMGLSTRLTRALTREFLKLVKFDGNELCPIKYKMGFESKRWPDKFVQTKIISNFLFPNSFLIQNLI